MKKLTFCIMLVGLSLSSKNVIAAISNKQLLINGQTEIQRTFRNQVSCVSSYMKFHIDKTMTASNGCIVHVVGDYNVLTGNFTGTISVACKGSVSPTVLTFGRLIVPNDGHDMSFGSGDEDGWNVFFANDPQFRQDVAMAIVTT